MPESVLQAIEELAMAYPQATHVVRLITTCQCCEDERAALQMVATGRGVTLELI